MSISVALIEGEIDVVVGTIESIDSVISVHNFGDESGKSHDKGKIMMKKVVLVVEDVVTENDNLVVFIEDRIERRWGIRDLVECAELL